MKFLNTIILLCFLGTIVAASDDLPHLFVLSGQSNMAGMDPKISFTPTVEKAFGKDKVIVVKDAKGGEPIHRWCKDWRMEGEETPKSRGDLYDRLLTKVKAAVDGRKIASVTFVWMQGERDARQKWGPVYAASLKSILKQLSADLSHEDINCVIGRLSDFDMENRRYPHWTMLREIQVDFTNKNPRCSWVNTDDLNDGVNRRGKPIKNDLHYSVRGYKTLGERFALKAIELIRNAKSEEHAKWKVTNSDSFDRIELGGQYIVPKQHKAGWVIKEGVLVGRQVKADHGAVIRRMLDFGDCEFECRFRFSDPQKNSRFNLVFDDANDKSVHAGHISRVSVSRSVIKLSDDKTGSMNNKVRALRKLTKLTTEQQQHLDKLMGDTTQKAKVKLHDDQWHHLWVQIRGSKLSVKLDGEFVASLDSPGIHHSTRNKYGFTVSAKEIEFDDLKMSVPMQTISRE